MQQPLRVELADLWQAAPLGDQLWGAQGHARRSAELTPLYLQRYVGPRSGQPLLVHSFWEMTFTFRGRWNFLDTNRHSVRPDSLILIPPELVHGEHAEEDVDTLWIGLRGSRLAGLPTARPVIITDEGLTPICEQLWLCSQRRYDLIGPELDGLLQVVFGRFVRAWQQASLTGGSKLDPAITYISQHLESDLEIPRLAELCGYSEGHFHRMFKQHFGVSPNVYVARSRVEKAIQLMQQSTLSINRIAALVGIADPLYFSRLFRKITGQSPSAMCAQVRRTSGAAMLPPKVTAHVGMSKDTGRE